MWAFGLAWGMFCLGCIAIVPIEEEPSLTPPRLKSSSYVSHELRQESEPAPPIHAGPQQKKTGYVHTVKWSGEGDGIHHRRLVYRGSAKLESPGASQSPNQSLSDLGGG